MNQLWPLLHLVLFLLLPVFLPSLLTHSLLSWASPWPVWAWRGAGRNKGMKTLSAVSSKVSELSGRPVIQVTNVKVYGVIVNPYGFIDPTCFFSAAVGLSRDALCRAHVVKRPSLLRISAAPFYYFSKKNAIPHPAYLCQRHPPFDCICFVLSRISLS